MTQFKNLVKLALPEVLEETAIGGKLGERLKAARAVARAQAEAAATEELVTLLKQFEDAKACKRMSLRRLRKEIDNLIGDLEELDRAFQYFEETQNVLPLLKQMHGWVNAYSVGLKGEDAEEVAKASVIPATFKVKKKK